MMQNSTGVNVCVMEIEVSSGKLLHLSSSVVSVFEG